MEQSEELNALKDNLEILEFHYAMYNEYKYKSKHEKLKRNRDNALSEMAAHVVICWSTKKKRRIEELEKQFSV